MPINEIVNNYSINQYLAYIRNGRAGNEPIGEFLPVSIFEKIVNTISTPVDESGSLAEYSSYVTSDTTSGPVTINLDPAAQYVIGRQYTFVNTGTNTLTIDANGSETINGELTLVISGQYEQATIYTDGTEWFISTSTSGSYSLQEVTDVGNTTSQTITTAGLTTTGASGLIQIGDNGSIQPTLERNTTSGGLILDTTITAGTADALLAVSNNSSRIFEVEGDGALNVFGDLNVEEANILLTSGFDIRETDNNSSIKFFDNVGTNGMEIYVNSALQLAFTNAGAAKFTGEVSTGSRVTGSILYSTGMTNITSDTDRFLMLDGTEIKYASGSDIVSYLPGPASSTGTQNRMVRFITANQLADSIVYTDDSHVAVNRTTVGDSSAIFQVDSTDKGFLPPRMTGAQRDAIVSPAEGLIVWQTDTYEATTKGLYVYDGSSWLKATLT